MADVILKGVGGSSIYSEDTTITAPFVFPGKTYVGLDTDDENGTGTMTDNGAVNPAALNASGEYTIPKGYHSGSGKVTTNSLASQTPGTASAPKIWKGKTAWVNGVQVTGSGELSDITANGSPSPASAYVTLTWTEPKDCFYDGVLITASTAVPGDPTASSYTVKLTQGTTSYAFGVSTRQRVTVYFKIRSYVYINGECILGPVHGTYNATSTCGSRCSCNCNNSCSCVNGAAGYSCSYSCK